MLPYGDVSIKSTDFTMFSAFRIQDGLLNVKDYTKIRKLIYYQISFTRLRNNYF